MWKYIRASIESDQLLTLDKIGPKESFHMEGSTLTHTIMVWSYAGRLGCSPLCEIAALWHDIGMIHGAEGHADASVEIFHEWIEKYLQLGISRTDIEYIDTLIRNHSKLYWVCSEADFYEKVNLIPELTGPQLRDLIILTIADIFGCWSKSWKTQVSRATVLSKLTDIDISSFEKIKDKYEVCCAKLETVSQG